MQSLLLIRSHRVVLPLYILNPSLPLAKSRVESSIGVAFGVLIGLLLLDLLINTILHCYSAVSASVHHVAAHKIALLIS